VQWKNERCEAAFVFPAPLTSKRSAKADKKCEARVCEFFHNGKDCCEAAFVFIINMDGWKL